MSQTKDNKMGTMSITKLIFNMSLPAMFSMLIMALYNIVDSIFVSQLGEGALTSVSLAFPIQMLVISFSVGTGIGVNSLISRRLGEKNYKEANSAATHGIIFNMILWVFFAIIGFFFSKNFILLCSTPNTNAQIIKDATSYLSIILVCSFGCFYEVSIEKAIQATGNMIYPMLFQLIGAIINIILDPIFIFGLLGVPKMGVTGAAVATVTGQIIAAIYAFYVAKTKKFPVTFSLSKFKFDFEIVKNIHKISIPSVIMQSITSILVTFLNMILMPLSSTAVAVLGVYFKLQSFVFMPVFGLNQGIMPIMGYNFGAKNKKRLLDSFKVSILIAATIMAIGTFIFMVFPRQLLYIFNASEQMYDIGTSALRTISICFIPAAVGIISATLFQAVGKGSYSLIVSVLRQLVIILPVAKILSNFGINATWYAFPIAEVVALAISLWMFAILYKNQIKNLYTEGEHLQNEYNSKNN